MDARLILAGQGPDVLGNLQQSTLAAAQTNAVTDQNRRREVFAEHGPGIVAGEEGALNALAMIDPDAALGVQGARQNMAATQQRMDMLTREEQRALAQYAAGITAQQAEAEAERVRQGVQAASAATTPEQWDALAQQFGVPEYVGQFENREAILRKLMSSADFVKQMAGQGRNVQNVDGVLYEIPSEGPVIPLTEPRDRAPLVQIGTGVDTGLGGALPGAPAADVPDGSGRSAFGLTGLITRGVNAVTDFVAGQEAFPVQGENTRFFRNLEEDLLVGLSQAYGRQPAQQLMERLRSLLPNVGTTEGAQAAYREVAVMRQRFERDLNVLTQQARRRMSDTQRQEVEARILGIQSALSQMDEAMRRLAPNPGGGAQIAPDVAERLRAYE